MKYSLTCVVKNSSGATKDLTESELAGITNGSFYSGGTVLLAGSKAVILCDLNGRYSLDTFRYYYSGDGNVDMEVAEAADTWNSISYTSISGGVSSDLNGYSPRWLRLSHEVTTGSGNMFEVDLRNDDSNILFGPYGSYNSYAIDSSGNQYEAVSVYNSSTIVRDVNVFVGEGVDTDADNLVTVSLAASGTYYSKREYGLYGPRDFSWDSGRHEGTINSLDTLTLSGTVTSGTYFSPVFYTGAYPNSRVFYDYNLTGSGYVDFRGELNGQSCIGVRKYNHAPTGGWVDKTLPNNDDPIWSTSSGSLQFVSTANNSILDLRNNYYIQFMLSISGTHPNPPYIIKLGIEGALSVEGIQPGDYKDVYVSSVSGTVGDKTTNLVCWYRE